MYSSKDFENLFFRYQVEGIPKGESIESFCMRNNVPYNLYFKWYRDTRKTISPVKIEGKPEEAEQTKTKTETDKKKDVAELPLRIMVSIRMSNGLKIEKKNLSYQELKTFVEKLEVLC